MSVDFLLTLSFDVFEKERFLMGCGCSVIGLPYLVVLKTAVESAAHVTFLCSYFGLYETTCHCSVSVLFSS